MTKKTFVSLACAGALFSIVNAPLIHADETVKPDAVETVKPAETAKPVETAKSEEPVVPKADAVDTGNKAETPAVPEAPTTTDTSKAETPAPAVPEAPTTTTDTSKAETPAVPEAPTTTTDTSKTSTEDKKPVEDKKDNTNLPLVNPVAPDAKPVETVKGTVTGTDNGKVIVKDEVTGQEQKVSPEELGGKVEKDGTVTVKEKDGKLTRLPNTGVEESLPLALAGMTMLTSGFGLLKRPRRKA